MDSSGTHRLCGHRVVPRRLSWVLFSIFVERFSLDSVGDGMAVVDWSVGF